MADAPTGSGAVGAITRKVGPLPLWAWAAIAVAGFYLYRRSHPGSSTGGGNTAGTPATTDQPYVPPFDAAGAGGGGGIGSTSTPSVVNNYYYGSAAGAQASGGGTSSGTRPGVDIGPGGVPVGFKSPPVTQPQGGQPTTSYHPAHVSYSVPASYSGPLGMAHPGLDF